MERKGPTYRRDGSKWSNSPLVNYLLSGLVASLVTNAQQAYIYYRSADPPRQGSVAQAQHRDPEAASAVVTGPLQISLVCPQVVRSFQSEILGELKGAEHQHSSYSVRLYVAPEDGKNLVWTPDDIKLSNGDETWSSSIRLGNPYGFAHVQGLPVRYDVYAVPVASKETRCPHYDGTEDSNLDDTLGKCSCPNPAHTAACFVPRHCKIERRSPETLPCRDTITITSPRPNTCPTLPDGHIYGRSCDPAVLAEVRSDSLDIRWTPPDEATVRLARIWGRTQDKYRSRTVLLPRPGDDSGKKPGIKVGKEDLKSGEYELTVSRDNCESVIWFRVP